MAPELRNDQNSPKNGSLNRDLLNFFTQLDPDLTLHCLLSSHLTTHPHDSGPGPPEAVVDPQVLLHLDGVVH